MTALPQVTSPEPESKPSFTESKVGLAINYASLFGILGSHSVYLWKLNPANVKLYDYMSKAVENPSVVTREKTAITNVLESVRKAENLDMKVFFTTAAVGGILGYVLGRKNTSKIEVSGIPQTASELQTTPDTTTTAHNHQGQTNHQNHSPIL